jgi:DNA-binding response OmpR family regulator
MKAKSTKILVVDDEPDFLAIVAHILKEKGYQVVTAPNGEDGLKAYAEEAPDLVILDGNLPDMDGFEICRRIRSRGPRPKTPILLCTVRSEVAPVAEGLGSGADDYILKPFEVSDLLSRVENALKAHEG